MQAHEILRDYFQRKQKRNPRFSLRSLAKNSQLSPSHLSRILNGIKRPSYQSLSVLAKLLEIDDWGLVRIEKALGGLEEKEEFLAPLSAEEILRDWKALAILEFCDLPGSNKSAKEVAQGLCLDEGDCAQILEFLCSLKLLTKEKAAFKKSDRLLRFPALSTRKYIRSYHRSALELAQKELEKGSDADYEARLIVSMCMTLERANLPVLKKKLQKLLQEHAQEFSVGDCDSVYQLSLQLIPLYCPEIRESD